MPRTYISESATAYVDVSHKTHMRCCQKVSTLLCNLIFFLVAGLIATIAGLVVWNHFGQPTTRQEVLDAMGKYDVNDFFNVLQNLTDAEWTQGFNEDPYVGDNSTQMWNGADGFSGLTLTLQNALDDEWQTEFAAAVEDWQESDALSLTAVQVEVDHSCTAVEGVMKVCNGNFWTNWLGWDQ